MSLPWGSVPTGLRELRARANDLLWQALLIRRSYQFNSLLPVNLSQQTRASLPPFPNLYYDACATPNSYSAPGASGQSQEHYQLNGTLQFIPSPGRVALVITAADRLSAFLNAVNDMEDYDMQLQRYRNELPGYVQALQDAIQSGCQ